MNKDDIQNAIDFTERTFESLADSLVTQGRLEPYQWQLLDTTRKELSLLYEALAKLEKLP